MRISDWSSDVCSSDLLDTMRRADWLIDVGPDAGEQGGKILYSGPPAGLRPVPESRTRAYLFGQEIGRESGRERVCQVRLDLGGRRNIKKHRPNTSNYIHILRQKQ